MVRRGSKRIGNLGSVSVRAAGMGEKAVLLPDELLRARRAGYQQVLHRPKCDRVQQGFAPGSVCTCEERT